MNSQEKSPDSADDKTPFDLLEAKTAAAFFAEISGDFPDFVDGCFVVVTHLLVDRPVFLSALERLAPVVLVIPKPDSIAPATLAVVMERWPVAHLHREDIGTSEGLLTIAKAVGKRKFITIDIGGYFSEPADALDKLLPGQYVGSVEGTKNGAERYLRRRSPSTVPWIDISHASVKIAEAYPIAQSIVFSAETILRELSQTFSGKNILVIGFGDIGEGLATILKSLGSVCVYDDDPRQLLRAKSRGFLTTLKFNALKYADCIFCATGNHALGAADLRSLKSGAIVFLATSGDDELEAEALTAFKLKLTNRHVTIYQGNARYFYLAHGGKAVNFLHGAEVRPFIRVVQAAFLAAIDLLLEPTELPPASNRLTDAVEKQLASVFLAYFGGLDDFNW